MESSSYRRPTWYQVLQVDPTADNDIISTVYRRLALRYHPDRDPPEEAQRVRMLLVNRQQLLTKALDLENSVRGSLKVFGLRVGVVTRRTFEARVLELVAEDRALRAKLVHNVGIVDDFMAHVDRRPIAFEKALDDFYGSQHASAEASGSSKQDLQLRLRVVNHGYLQSRLVKWSRHPQPTIVAIPEAWKAQTTVCVVQLG